MKFGRIAFALSFFAAAAQCADSSSLNKDTAPFVKGNTIVCGEKSLVVQPNGRLKIFSDGRELAKINNTVRLKEGGHMESASKTFFTLDEMKNDGKGKFELNGTFKFRADGSVTGKFSQVTELLSDGRIKITAAFIAPEGYEKEMGDISIFFNFDVGLVQDKEFSVTGADGKTQTLTFPTEAKYAFFTVSNPRSLTLFSKDPTLSMSIEPLACRMVLGWSKPEESILRFHDLNSQVSLILDLRR